MTSKKIADVPVDCSTMPNRKKCTGSAYLYFWGVDRWGSMCMTYLNESTIKTDVSINVGRLLHKERVFSASHYHIMSTLASITRLVLSPLAPRPNAILKQILLVTPYFVCSIVRNVRLSAIRAPDSNHWYSWAALGRTAKLVARHMYCVIVVRDVFDDVSRLELRRT